MSDNGDLVIVRTVDPVCLIEVLEGEVNTGKPCKTYIHNGEVFTLSFFFTHFSIRDKEAAAALTAQAINKKASKVLDDAFYWYKAYIDWADERLEEE